MKDIKQYKAIMFMEKQIHKYGEATVLPTVHSIILKWDFVVGWYELD